MAPLAAALRIAAAVNILVAEPIWNSVSAVTGTPVSCVGDAEPLRPHDPIAGHDGHGGSGRSRGDERFADGRLRLDEGLRVDRLTQADEGRGGGQYGEQAVAASERGTSRRRMTAILGRHFARHGARMSSAGSAPGLGTNFCVRPYWLSPP